MLVSNFALHELANSTAAAAPGSGLLCGGQFSAGVRELGGTLAQPSLISTHPRARV